MQKTTELEDRIERARTQMLLEAEAIQTLVRMREEVRRAHSKLTFNEKAYQAALSAALVMWEVAAQCYAENVDEMDTDDDLT